MFSSRRLTPLQIFARLLSASAVAVLTTSPAWAYEYDDDPFGLGSLSGKKGATSDMVYAAAGVGCSQAKLDALDVSDFDPGASTTGKSKNCLHLIDAAVGLQFHKNIALEIGYKNVGKFNASAAGSELGVPLTETAHYKANGYHATVVGQVPIAKDVDLIGRLGAFRWRWHLTSTGVEGGFPFARDETTRGTSLTYGAGIQYRFSNHISARLEWQRFEKVGEQQQNGQTNIDAITLGLVYRF